MSWIISRREDLLWFHASVLPALALGALFAFGPRHAELAVLCAWGVLFDGTHVFGTYARTWFAGERSELAPAAWLLLLVGPAVAVVEHTVLPGAFAVFLLGAYLWAYWHLVRQHWGFLALYRRGAPSRLGSLLWLGCVYPFVRFGLSQAYLTSGLPQLFPVAVLPHMRLALDLLTIGALVAVLVMRALDRRPLKPSPAHLYVSLAIALHLLTFAFVPGLLPIMATLTLFHDLEYHRIVWRYERGRGRKPLGGLGRYLAAGLIFGVAWYVPRILGAAAAPPLARDLLVGGGWGVAFHHYFVDARIWRLRKPAVRQALAA